MQDAQSSTRSNYFIEMCSDSEEDSYLRLINFVSLNSRLESNEEETTKEEASTALAAPGILGLGLCRNRGASLIRNQPPLGPYSETMPRALG